LKKFIPPKNRFKFCALLILCDLPVIKWYVLFTSEVTSILG